MDWNLDDCILELAGVRLWKYLEANYGHKYLLAGADGDCPWTGYCTDCPFFDPFRDFINRPRQGVTFQELLDDAIGAFLSAVREECEYIYTDEYADESIEANEYEFLEDGTRY